MRLSLIGLSTLNALGLQTLIGECCPGCDVTVDEAPDPAALADAYVVSAAALATYARLLMPRLDRVLLLTTSAQAGGPMAMLSPLAPQKDILKALERLLANARNSESHSGGRPQLTPRELDVMRLTARGLSSKQVADQLCISINTVLTHRKNIAAKTGLHTASAWTHFAMTHGLL